MQREIDNPPLQRPPGAHGPGALLWEGLGWRNVAPLLTYRRWLPKAEPTTLLRSVAQRNACKGRLCSTLG
jgi:hypothetical protein